MIPCDKFYSALINENIGFFAGVPDSLLKDICGYISDHAPAGRHVIAANEGAALGLAAGSYLATARPGLVYLQNSGLGNLINPLTSLTDPEVYSIPVLLLIGWRGEPGVHDEPQHRKQGRVMLSTLDALEIPYEILPESLEAAEKIITSAAKSIRERSAPYAIVVRKNTFESYKLQGKAPDAQLLRREDALKLILDSLRADEVIVSTTGMASREVFEYRENAKSGHSKDFLTVGCMGHASQIALGVALEKPHRPVYCLDGDGSTIMHMGSLAIIGATGLRNFRHVVINNGAHDSVGGQPTVGMHVNFSAIATACGYRWVRSTNDPDVIPRLLSEMANSTGPAFFEIKVNKGARADLGRPTTTTFDNKREFMTYLQ
ncbi:MAG: phosphonopyruvate decarboxylase [Dechloromonas sp.]|nr:MAG: phosphonopyruvate decarboxylase [Dechloromonas sp.]